MKKAPSSHLADEALRIRVSQLVVNEKYKANAFKIPIHLALGHEAFAAALNAAMEKQDKLLLSHRNIAHNLAREGTLRPLMDEYLLKSEGLAGGRLGSMNLSNPKKGVIYTSSILGNNFPVAAGVAMSQAIEKTGGATFVLGGDGSMEEGTFYESLVLMQSVGLPAVVIIENNEWSMATRIDERRKPIDLAKMSQALGIEYSKLSGNDVYEYAETLKKIRERCVKNQAPVCVEVLLSTLGDWRMKTAEQPDGKFVNYHAGPAPTLGLDASFVIKENAEDPVFVLRDYFSAEALSQKAEKIRESITQELA